MEVAQAEMQRDVEDLIELASWGERHAREGVKPSDVEGAIPRASVTGMLCLRGKHSLTVVAPFGAVCVIKMVGLLELVQGPRLPFDPHRRALLRSTR
jgi:hypothetical protein